MLSVHLCLSENMTAVNGIIWDDARKRNITRNWQRNRCARAWGTRGQLTPPHITMKNGGGGGKAMLYPANQDMTRIHSLWTTYWNI